MTDALVESVRLRGPHAARLARVAAGHLPSALDRALSGLAPGRVDNVTVVLDIDIDASDDATIAAIWAHEVRAEVARHIDASARTDSIDTGVRHAEAHEVTARDALAAARAWLAQATPRGPVPFAALALAAIVSEQPDSAWATSARVRTAIIDLDRAISEARTGGTHPRAAHQPSDPVSRPQPLPPAVSPSVQATAQEREVPRERAAGTHGPESSLDPRRDAASGPGAAELARAAAARVSTLSDLAGSGSANLDVHDLTSAAGLALLYPWLADLCRAAEGLHPGLDPAEVRAVALAALVDPADHALTDDPLVRVLAGCAASPHVRVRLPQADAVVAEADRALESFASLLAGFESSSPEFVRREWVARTGLLEQDREPMRLTAATHPLDVVLTRLPYPVSLFKLPWSPPISVRFRP